MEHNLGILSYTKKYYIGTIKTIYQWLCQNLGLGCISHPKKGKWEEITVLEMVTKYRVMKSCNWMNSVKMGKGAVRRVNSPELPWSWRRPEQPSRESQVQASHWGGQKFRPSLLQEWAPQARIFASQIWNLEFCSQSKAKLKQRHSEISESCPQLFSTLRHRQLAKPLLFRWSQGVTEEEGNLKLKSLGFSSRKCIPRKVWGAG